MSNINKMVVNLITVSRHKGNVVIITTPSRGQIDVQIRNMCSHWAEITDSHHEEGYNAMSFRRVFFNQNNGKTFTANLTAQDLGYEGAHANKLKFNRWIVPKPDDKKLIREYEKMILTQGDALIVESQELLQAQLEQQKDKQLGNKKKNKKEEPITNIPIKTEKQRETVRKVEEVEEYLARGYTRTSACKMVKLDIKTYTKYKRGY